MKIIINRMLMLVTALVVLASCEKDEVKAVYKMGNSPVLTTSSNALILEQENAANDALTMNWSAADYGYSAAQTFTLQMAPNGSDFTGDMAEVNVRAASSKTFTVGELNREMLKIIPFGQASEVDVRIKSFVTDSIAPAYSNTITLTITPYQDIILYSYPQALNVAGNYQDWSPDKAPQIVSLSNDGDYEGYINFDNATPEFKIVKGDNWGAGDFGDAGSGKLSNGGNNLKLTEGAGVYRLKANTTTMTWSATRITTWGVIGSATTNGWDASTPMEFDEATGSWVLVSNLVEGELKFRANNGWDINFGDNKSNLDGKPDYGGDNIAITSAGSYTIRLNIGVAGNYSYTIKKNL
ncbi:SusE domain-containing protein [Flavihumibacter sediminis]|nr:SusE domain-containing protein [Flavihumibacter sediminis]